MPHFCPTQAGRHESARCPCLYLSEQGGAATHPEAIKISCPGFLSVFILQARDEQNLNRLTPQLAMLTRQLGGAGSLSLSQDSKECNSADWAVDQSQWHVGAAAAAAAAAANATQRLKGRAGRVAAAGLLLHLAEGPRARAGTHKPMHTQNKTKQTNTQCKRAIERHRNRAQGLRGESECPFHLKELQLASR